jgi:uncharacterized membrane protein
VPEFTVLEKGCWVGPNVVFTNALHPLCKRAKDCLKGATVKPGAKIGANSVINQDVAPGMLAVAPRALLFFRWAAVVTWLAGAALLGPRFVPAFTLQPEAAYIGIGAWLGTIMLFNVWALIWPNQKKILGMTPASDDDKNRARRVAFLASRTNTMLSIPMLFFMGAGVHGF